MATKQKQWPPLEGMQDIQRTQPATCWRCGGFGYLSPPHLDVTLTQEWEEYQQEKQSSLRKNASDDINSPVGASS